MIITETITICDLLWRLENPMCGSLKTKFIKSLCLLIYRASLVFQDIVSGSKSMIVVLSQSIEWCNSQTCADIADLSTSPLRTASLCCLTLDDKLSSYQFLQHW